VNFSRFGDALSYLSKKKDYKFGINFSKENRLYPGEILNKKSTLIPLNDSLMYFKDEVIVL